MKVGAKIGFVSESESCVSGEAVRECDAIRKLEKPKRHCFRFSSNGSSHFSALFSAKREWVGFGPLLGLYLGFVTCFSIGRVSK